VNKRYLSPVKNWISSEDERQCDYQTEKNLKVETHQIIVKKRFSKTVDINCYWFNRRTSIQYNDREYLVCAFGKKIDKNYEKEGGICHFV